MNSHILTAFALYTRLEMLLVSDNLCISNQKEVFINFQKMLLYTKYMYLCIEEKECQEFYCRVFWHNFEEYHVPVTAFHYVTPAYGIYDMLHSRAVMQSDLSGVTQSEALANV